MRIKNKVTHISCCNKGDRFYLARDVKKTVWELEQHTAKWVRGEIRKVSICKDELGQKRTFLSMRMIIFLSQKKQIEQKQFVSPTQIQLIPFK